MRFSWFWRWYDRAARVDFGGNLLGYVLDWKAGAFWGWIVSLFGLSAISDWSPAAIWVASFICGACLAIIFMAIRYALGMRLVGGGLFNSSIPVLEAARRMHEALEPVDQNYWGEYGGDISAEAKLDHCIYIFLADARDGLIKIQGVVPPSRISRIVPPDSIPSLHVRPGTGVIFNSRIQYQNVSLSKSDLKKAIAHRIGLHEALKEQRL